MLRFMKSIIPLYSLHVLVIGYCIRNIEVVYTIISHTYREGRYRDSIDMIYGLYLS